jgi:anaerobic dimethyl sulfoxide reductase subunit B (iron-sulfur subunit)
MTQYGFYFDSTRCTGCHTCELACKDYHDLTQAETLRHVYDCEGGATEEAADGTVSTNAFAYHVSVACNHCANPGCIAATGNDGTIVKDEETGLVRIVDAASIADPEGVISACPYRAPMIDSQTGLLVKCDGCYDRVVAGLQPICVGACPLRALEFGPLEDLEAVHPDATDQIAPLADPTLTQPSIRIEACDASAEAAESDDGPTVTNAETLEGVLAWA